MSVLSNKHESTYSWFRTMNSYATAREEFFHWALKWFYNQSENQEVARDLDTPHFIVLINLLQAIGFDLKYMQKLPGNEEDTFYSITIKSPSTHQQALLTSCKQDNMKKSEGLLFPDIAPGIARFTREILSYIIKILDKSIILDEKDNAHVNAELKENGIPNTLRWQRHRSLDTMMSSRDGPNTNSAPVQMDVDIPPSTSGQQMSSSPLLGGSTNMGLLRQKTWSLGSIADLDDLQLSSAPAQTSSPINIPEDNTNLLERLREITGQLQELMQDVSKKKASVGHKTKMDGRKPDTKGKATEMKHKAKLQSSSSLMSRLPLTGKKGAQQSSRRAGSLTNLSDSPHTRSSRYVKPRTTSKPTSCGIPRPAAHSVFNLHSPVVEADKINSKRTTFPCKEISRTTRSTVKTPSMK